MSGVNLRPLAKSQDAMLSYLDTNFRRISDTLGALGLIESGEFDVTGALEIDTGIASVKQVVAVLAEPPLANGCFVAASLAGPSDPRNVILEVFKNDFTYSVVPKKVQWIAVGNP